MATTVVPIRQASIQRSLQQVAFDQLALPLFCLDAHGRILAANSAACVMLGVPAEASLGHALGEFLALRGDSAFVRRWGRLRKFLSTGQSVEVFAKLPLRGGQRTVARLLARRFEIEQQEVISLLVQDISAERAALRSVRQEADRIRALPEYQSELTVLLNAEHRVTYVSPAFMAITGERERDLLGSPFEFMLEEGSRQDFRRLWQELKLHPDGRSRSIKWQLRARADGAQSARHTIVGQFANRLNDPHLRGLILTARDTRSDIALEPERAAQARQLTFRKQLLELATHPKGDFADSLALTLRATADVIEVNTVSFWRLARQPTILLCEALFDRNSGRFQRDWVGHELPLPPHSAYIGQILNAKQAVVVEDLSNSPFSGAVAHDIFANRNCALLDVPVLVGGEVQGVLRLQHDQPRRWYEEDIELTSTAALMLALAIETAQRLESEERNEHLAWYDPLTGLPNRNLLRDTLRDLLVTAANRKHRAAVMLIDLDRFKDVNDTLGHVIGDALIKSAADIVCETVGDVGTVARLGGDEFVVMLKHFVHRQEVALLAARIAQALHRTDLLPNVETQVSASIGVALFPEHGRDMSTLLKNADAAMYQAKRDGRNQISFFNPIRYERASREVQLGIQLVKAVQSNSQQFVCEYQPQIEMRSGRTVGLEALIRWRHPVHGLLTPDRFIGVAEMSGLSERITHWVFNEVCAQINRWRAVLPDFDIPISINVAGREMGSSALPLLVRSALLKHAIEPAMIALEITERTLVKESEVNNDVLAELASIGIGLVLDDFGTGYSMLGYLKRMPIQALKIDQSFIEGIPADPDSRAIVHAMLAVARHFRLKVVAEGIESREQVDYLRGIGCEYAQGFFYARALSSEAVLPYLMVAS